MELLVLSSTGIMSSLSAEERNRLLRERRQAKMAEGNATNRLNSILTQGSSVKTQRVESVLDRPEATNTGASANAPASEHSALVHDDPEVPDIDSVSQGGNRALDYDTMFQNRVGGTWAENTAGANASSGAGASAAGASNSSVAGANVDTRGGAGNAAGSAGVDREGAPDFEALMQNILGGAGAGNAPRAGAGNTPGAGAGAEADMFRQMFGGAGGGGEAEMLQQIFGADSSGSGAGAGMGLLQLMLGGDGAGAGADGGLGMLLLMMNSMGEGQQGLNPEHMLYQAQMEQYRLYAQKMWKARFLAVRMVLHTANFWYHYFASNGGMSAASYSYVRHQAVSPAAQRFFEVFITMEVVIIASYYLIMSKEKLLWALSRDHFLSRGLSMLSAVAPVAARYKPVVDLALVYWGGVSILMGDIMLLVFYYGATSVLG